MTNTPEDAEDPQERGASSGNPGAGRKIDEDAAWREIVAHYGERPSLDPEPSPGAPVDPSADPPPGSLPEPPKPVDPGPPDLAERERRLNDLFRPSWNDPLNTEATWDDEGRFVPPPAPPVSIPDPRRRAAWAGLFGSPLLMLVAVVLGWQLPGWLMLGLTGGFVGGFVYLVATMPNRRSDGGDDGAVV